MTFTLRDYQEEAVDSLFNYFYENKEGNPLIVAPTGSGKSLMIAGFISEVYQRYPKQNILILQHRMELIQQNFEKLVKLCPPRVHLGLYSAGLNAKDIGARCTVAGVQSIYNKSYKLRKIDLVLIDECQLLPPEGEGMYQTLLAELKKKNPRLRIIGFTATPFRLKTGSLLDDGGMFSDIAYNTDINRLINDGWLSPLISKSSVESPNLKDVKIRAGEFVTSDLEKIMGAQEISVSVLQEFYKYAHDRESVLVFCSSVQHAEFFKEMLEQNNESVGIVTGSTGKELRAKTLQQFKNKKIRFLVNVDVLTVGFDAPNVDCILGLRPTQSAGLWVQMCGRGMRLAPGKENCLVLDFGGNIERHGPIDGIQVRTRVKQNRKTGKFEKSSQVEKSEVKICEACRNACYANVSKCPLCGYVFPLKIKHEAEASSAEVMGKDKPVEDTFGVFKTEYEIHVKEGRPPIFKIKFRCGMYFWISDFLCFEHEGYARKIAVKKWKKLAIEPSIVPTSSDEALFYAETGSLKSVNEIKCRKKAGEKFWGIIGYKYDEDIPEPEPLTTEDIFNGSNLDDFF